WCSPCRMQGPIVERLAKKYAGKAAIGKMNVDENPVVPQQFGISGIPTLIVFKDGEEARRFVGVQTEGALVSELDTFISSSSR
ncbi:MAG: thioredoxin domain-containing protein, partial [Candidatus Omnitrophota bacterium]